MNKLSINAAVNFQGMTLGMRTREMSSASIPGFSFSRQFHVFPLTVAPKFALDDAILSVMRILVVSVPIFLQEAR